jgi:putative restriction endonuclease
MKLFVGVTDFDWYAYLSSIENIDEVNFWQPGGRTVFKSFELGELFLFKLHSPHNFIVGGGFFAHSTLEIRGREIRGRHTGFGGDKLRQI